MNSVTIPISESGVTLKAQDSGFDGDRPRSGSKGLMDFFRLRRKSGSGTNLVNSTTLKLQTNDDRENEKQSKPKTILTRKRSNSLANEALGIPESLRISLAKQQLATKMSPLEDSTPTPMSQLLSSSFRDENNPKFPLKDGKVRPQDFLAMYSRSRRFSLDHSPEAPCLVTSRQRKFSNVKLPPEHSPSSKQMAIAPDVKQAAVSSSRRLLTSIPSHVAVSSPLTKGSRSRRVSVFSPPSDRSEEGRFKQLDLVSRQRRFSEPRRPKLEQFKSLSSSHSRFFPQESTADTMSNFPKFTPSPPKNHITSAALNNSFSNYIPSESQHFVIWKEKNKMDKVIILPCDSDLETIEDLGAEENLIFVKFLKSHKCYELMPLSAKLVLLDLELKVTSAFDALMHNGIRSAPVWDGDRQEFIGMLTITDFIRILQKFREDKLDDVCSQRISQWRTLLEDDMKEMVSIDANQSLFEAVRSLRNSSVHRLLVQDDVSDEALYVLTYRRIMHYVWHVFVSLHLPVPEFMGKSIKELNVGTFDDLASVKLSTRLMDVLHVLIERRLSAVPVLDSNDKVINMYEKSDVMNLVLYESYKYLDSVVEDALSCERPGFEGVYICKKNHSLGSVIDWMIKADVHRLVVVDDDGHLDGIVSISDIVNFLVLQQNAEDTETYNDDVEVEPENEFF